jgi:integrase
VDKAVKGRKRDAPIRGTKSGKGKRLPAPDELDTWIAEWVAPEDRLCRAPLFANPSTGKRWTPSSIRRTWEAACRAVGIEGISVYEGCKHSFATDAVARGVPERHLQTYLGHADVRSTRHYARLANSALIQVLRPAKVTPAEDGLSHTCPACSERPCNCAESSMKIGGGGGNRTRVPV